MKIPKLEFEKVNSGKYQALQEYGWKQIIYIITTLESGGFLLEVMNVNYDNSHISTTFDDAIRRDNEINKSLMLLRYNRIMQNAYF